MHLHAVHIRNFRRLKDVHIDFEHDISIFVGSNNSGKTSATTAMDRLLNGDRAAISLHDFSCDCWHAFDLIEVAIRANAELPKFPTLGMDLWLAVQAPDLNRVLALLPNMDWRGTRVGIRIEFCPKDSQVTVSRFREAIQEVAEYVRPAGNGHLEYRPWPASLREFLLKTLKDEYVFKYYVLDQAAFNDEFMAPSDYQPHELATDHEGGGRSLLASLIKIDFLSAQRHIDESSSGGARAETLSKCLSRFYSHNLEQRDDDHDALRTLANSEEQLSQHMMAVFASTIDKLRTLGYPGLSNPRLLIKSALRLDRLMNDQHASVHYVLGEPGDQAGNFTLPDSYNGLGFKNLIYMVVELLDLHARWLTPADEEQMQRPLLHLVFVEEPEVHMHAQLQQAFIRKVFDLLKVEGEDADIYKSQLVVTTHSPHILYERGFRHIRYFRRSPRGAPWPASEVSNLSIFYDQNEEDRDFLERYMKLTHCNLFFADAAILVEGNVERLLLPLIIARCAPALQSTYLSILEVGGAFAHRFRRLIEFLGLTTLIITDIDSVYPTPEDAVTTDGAEEDADVPPTGGAGEPSPGSSCPVLTPGAVTSNQMLVNWLPARSTIADLLESSADERTQTATAESRATVHVTYQLRQQVTWNGVTAAVAGRTLEESFAYENLVWVQDAARQSLQLRIRNSAALSTSEMAARIYKRVKSKGFEKTDFALGVLDSKPDEWTVPAYIANGLAWLKDQLLPPENPAQLGEPPAGGAAP